MGWIQCVWSYLNNQGFSGGAAADDGFRDAVALSASLVVQHGSSNGCRPGEINYPVAVEVVLATQVLDSWRRRYSHCMQRIHLNISVFSKKSHRGSYVWPQSLWCWWWWLQQGWWTSGCSLRFQKKETDLQNTANIFQTFSLSVCSLCEGEVCRCGKRNDRKRTSWQVAHREAVLDPVAGLSITPTLQAGVFLLRRLQHVVTAQTLKKEQVGKKISRLPDEQ